MAGAVAHAWSGANARNYEDSAATREPWLVKWTIIAISLAFFGFFLLLPLVAVFTEAFRKGVEAYFAALSDPDALSSIKLTLIAAAIAVPLNLVF
ncbi:MAG TPA: sulfate/thiosulfate ABC transporter permease CysW, partial [Rhodocyclaceae bacterium]|nr:sulfate/thiosulfate ABC transporter permease CysW [Rhodocyclaceae bacterium]